MMDRSLQGLIATMYPAPEWAVFYEVANGTGAHVKRRADALALGIWPSRGMSLVGFEIKEDRRDWLRELDNPAKAEMLCQHCDLWWLVTSDAAVAKPEELPAPWGLLVRAAKRDRLEVVKQAIPFPDRDKTVMKRSLVAAMLRKVPETTIPTATFNEQLEAAVSERIRLHTDGRQLEYARDEIKKLQGTIEAFESASGVDITNYHGPKKIGAVVRMILNGDYSVSSLQSTARQLRAIGDEITAALNDWPILKEQK